MSNYYNTCVSLFYLGKNFFGSQSQPNLPTVESEIIKSLKLYFSNFKDFTLASRTDKGVSGFQYFGLKIADSNIHEIHRKFDEIRLKLSEDIHIKKVYFMPDNFNVRKDALVRTYIYKITDKKLIDSVNIENMRLASNYLIGKNNFMSFSGRNAKNKFIREIYKIKIIILDKILFFEISGKSFIHQQIRRIIYSLIRIGLGKETKEWLEILINFPSKGGSKGIVSSNNLTLKEVLYHKNHQKILEKV